MREEKRTSLLMTRLVQIASGLSGVVAVAAVVISIGPRRYTSDFVPGLQDTTQVKIVIATPYVPIDSIELLPQPVAPKHELPPKNSPNLY